MNRVSNSKSGCQVISPEGLNLPLVIQDSFGKWLDGMGEWQWYATLTFRDPSDPRFPNWSRVGWKSAQNALENFNSALVDDLNYQNPVWVACMELQRRGVPHWHMLVGGVGEARRMRWVDWWWSHYGIARILPYMRELGARYYLGKYLVKEVADIRFSPALKCRLTENEQTAIDHWRLQQLYG